MNARCYTIFINALMKNFNKYKSQRELLAFIFKDGYQIEFEEMDNYLELKKSIGLIAGELRAVVVQLKSRMSIKALSKGYEITGNDLFLIGKMYLTVVKKHEAYANIYMQLEPNPNWEEEISINRRLMFSIITSKKYGRKLIILESPAFNVLNIEEIKEMLGFGEHTGCKSYEDMIKFINKYERVFRQGFSSNYLIKGNVIYYNIYQSEIGL